VRGDLDPAVHQARLVDGDGILRGSLEGLACLDVEDTAVARALDGGLSVVERPLGKSAPRVRALIREGEQPRFHVRDGHTAHRQIERANLSLGDLRDRSDANEIHSYARTSADQPRCSAVTAPSTAKITRIGVIAPGTTSPMSSAMNRSSRWKNPSVSCTPTASASARM
jgi:hypothetical protein